MKVLWRSPALAGVLIVLLTVVAYLPAMRGGFIWDDDDHLTENPAMTAAHGLRQIWTSLAVSRYYPLTLTSFWVQRRLWGLNPLPYHAVNIALHAANAVLIFLLLRRLRVPAAWLAAALWALHPVCVESVAWVTELKNTQSGFFFFLALLCFVRFEERPTWSLYALTLLCATAAMLSKPSTVVLPAVLLLVVWWQHGRWQRSDWLRTAPLFAFAVGMSALTILEQRGHIGRGGPHEILGYPERLLLAGKIVWFYLGKIVWPVDLMFIYPRWKLDANSWVNWLPLVAAIVAGAVLWKLRHRLSGRVCLFGFGYFAVLLLPVSGFFDIYFFRYSFVGDHFQYLACLGPVTLLTACVISPIRSQPVRMTIAVLLLLLFASHTWQYSRVFKNDKTLWCDTLAKNPDAWMAHNNLGFELFRSGKIEDAITEYRTSLRLKPDNVEARSNLGFALAERGALSEAIAEYEAALKIQPNYAEAHNNLGLALARQGKFAQATAEYQEALRMNPEFAEAHTNLGNILASEGKIAAAMGEYAMALRIKPDDARAHYNRAVVLARNGRVPEAITEYQAALRIKPDYAEAHDNLGMALAGQGRIPEAIDEYRAALRINPNSVTAHNNLGLALTEQGKRAEAIAEYQTALNVNPDYAEARRQLCQCPGRRRQVCGGNCRV